MVPPKTITPALAIIALVIISYADIKPQTAFAQSESSYANQFLEELRGMERKWDSVMESHRNRNRQFFIDKSDVAIRDNIECKTDKNNSNNINLENASLLLKKTINFENNSKAWIRRIKQLADSSRQNGDRICNSVDKYDIIGWQRCTIATYNSNQIGKVMITAGYLDVALSNYLTNTVKELAECMKSKGENYNLKIQLWTSDIESANKTVIEAYKNYQNMANQFYNP
jgi:hypothetical protein